MKTKIIKIAEIAIDGGTQQREKIDESIVEEYAEAMRCGAKFPAASVFFDGAQYWLADGFHRYHAHRAAEIDEITCDVHEGTNRDAILFSAGTNGAHGLRLTNADKRKSVLVLLLDREWSGWSDATIAKHCKVTHPFVGKLRKEISNSGTATPVTVTGKPTKPAPVLESEKKLSTISDADDGYSYDPKESELQEARDAITDLAEQNDALRYKLGVSVLDITEEEKQIIYDEMIELNARIRSLEAEVSAITSMRDALMRENAEMKKQLLSQRNQIKKLGGK